MSNIERDLTVHKVAIKFDVADETIRRWLKNPNYPLKGYKLPGGTIRICPKSVEKCKEQIEKTPINV